MAWMDRVAHGAASVNDSDGGLPEIQTAADDFVEEWIADSVIFSGSLMKTQNRLDTGLIEGPC